MQFLPFIILATCLSNLVSPSSLLASDGEVPKGDIACIKTLLARLAEDGTQIEHNGMILSFEPLNPKPDSAGSPTASQELVSPKTEIKSQQGDSKSQGRGDSDQHISEILKKVLESNKLTPFKEPPSADAKIQENEPSIRSSPLNQDIFNAHLGIVKTSEEILRELFPDEN